jgi:hypothetical protein
MEAAFRAWWQESYGLPPGPHAVMTHVAWGEHLLATRPSLELPDGLLEQWSEEAGNRQLTLAETDRFIAEQSLAWAWRQRG